MSSSSDPAAPDQAPWSRVSRPSRPSYVPPPLRSNQHGVGRGRAAHYGYHNSYQILESGGSHGGSYVPGYTNSSHGSDQVDDMANTFTKMEMTENETKGGINFDAYEDIPVEATGEDVPAPANTFAEIDLGKAVNANIVRCKYVKPTPVQRHGIPIAVAGRDLMACAQTGSGKTAAFCFPIISGIMRGRQVARGYGRGAAQPLALILSPTRELTCQIYEEARKFSYQTGLKIVVVYGGAPMFQQLRNLERGVDVLVATPGRLVDLIDRQRVSLQMIKYLALDEADRMLDMGFEPQIRKIVEQRDMPPPGSRQTLLFSATFPPEIQKLASDFLHNYIFLSVGRVGSSTELIAQKVELVQVMDKNNSLMDLLRGQSMNDSLGKLSLTLIFVETKRKADILEGWLSRNGFPAIAIHGDKVQMERERALKSFKRGETPVLVATDVASRGLDIPCVAHVINYDLPKDIDSYVHRIGRTGRAGNSGLATAFFCDKDMSLAKSLADLMQEANQEVPSWLTQYAESNYGYDSGSSRSRRNGGNRFGGHDVRNNNDYDNNQYGYGEGDYGYSASYGGDTNNSDSASQRAFSYAFPAESQYENGYDTSGVYTQAGGANEYAPDYGTITATGWE